MKISKAYTLSYTILFYILTPVLIHCSENPPVANQSTKPYPCQSCGKKFKQQSLATRCQVADEHKNRITQHTLLNPQDDLLQTYECQFCHKEGFKSLDQLKTHLRQHITRNATCPFCKTKMSPRSLNNHMLLKHTPFRPFKCGWSGCVYTAVQAISVESHIITHIRREEKKQTEPQPKKTRNKPYTQQPRQKKRRKIPREASGLLQLASAINMRHTFHPINDNVLIKLCKEDEEKPMPDKARKGNVLAVGSGRHDKDGTLIPMHVKPGDIVFFNRSSGILINDIGLIVNQREILGITKTSVSN